MTRYESSPPIAKKIPKQLEIHGDVRTDDYYWLRERENPEVIAYLEAENQFVDDTMAHTKALQDELYQEIIDRIAPDDDSVPYRKGEYYYYHRYEDGGDYRIYCRKQGSLDAAEQVMVDGNELSEGHEYFSLSGVEASPDHRHLAYSIDTVGRRLYTLRIRDLQTGQDLPDVIPAMTADVAWANDGQTIFYVRQHPETLRWYQVYRHILGTDPAQDALAYEETDEEFGVDVYRSKSDRFVFIRSQQTLSTEFLYVDANHPDRPFEVFEPREADHEYSVDHLGGTFFVRSNWQAENFRLMKVQEGATTKERWTEIIPHREDIFLEDFELFRSHLVAEERKDGLIQLRVFEMDNGESHYIDFGEPAYFAYTSDNHEADSSFVRYRYTSLTTPYSVIDYDFAEREKTLRKEDPVLGGFDKANYTSERLWGRARDGVQIPVSLVYRTDLFKEDGTNPLLLYGYGSYGSSMDAYFRSYRLSLLDRGFVFAIAHVRGGQELGRQWYEDGKLLKKMNTFTDFVDCARFLVDRSYTSPAVLFAEGGSAGGLLMGAITNLAPDLFQGILNHVPFVDVVTTMLDDDIPLTSSEYDEWGDPHDPEYYDYMLSYSPYDNLAAVEYPHILVTSGLNDSQVQYWEPAKYVAKLRSLKTDQNRLLLMTNLEAGHGLSSGRLKRHRETALFYAFLLDLVS